VSNNTLIPHSIDVSTSRIPEYIDFLENYLGIVEVTHRLQQISRAIQMERGMAYLHYWLLPNSAFWIGLQEARQQVSTISPALENTLEVAAKLRILYSSMSSRVKDDLRTRILKADYLSPIFFEIDIAAHFWQLGYEIEWAEPADKSGRRIPEFTLTNGSHKIEVECKVKRADAGRKILRPNFYKLVDSVAAPLSVLGYTGKIDIVVPDRMPVQDSWKKLVARAIDQSLTTSSAQAKLDDGTQITINIHKVDGMVIPGENIVAEAQRNKRPYSQLAVFTKEYGTTLANPLIFELGSQSDDRVIADISDNLKDANRQFTGDNAAVICCFVPEINSFASIDQDSALVRMTASFFEKHAKPNVFAVSYSSDSIRSVTMTEISKSSPAISFPNPNYDDKFGPKTRIFQ
jgi:hypothetical protein